ncbi:pilus assembly FimT family protein [Deinococcus cellulosilyticus]|uniref:Prepilin-type N-terminal cleavage/methylation domain-containing protein n=1 Tax=Deinococcus cellulosilyticus (strain DSM 18568 / NBRC 106333 / KACC 11606 / 5516J-15) TaxID=1223518 RepID=A0A511N9G2_DEIC1|nr:prepilin-type N-terminal cleavage/methylation domain-containing protein [Deinococcus cellulosilyticus]GEM49128.1 hypothetical protein DC3_47630 [Deinococcus cellulosilyticus NBRC 106333 = KACC 11606]
MRSHQSRTAGFTLLEMLAVLAVLSVLLALGASSYSTYRNQMQVKEAAEQFARDLQAQHFNAKRTNTTQSVVVVAQATTYTAGGSNRTLPSGVRFSTGGTVNFYPPYGTTIAQNGTADPTTQSFTLSNNNHSRTVTVVGLIGKVIVK